MQIHDFMPKCGKDKEWFKKAVVRDITTKEIVEGDWARLKPVDHIAYENFLSKVVNQEAGESSTKKDEAGFTIKRTGAWYIVTVITRVRR